MLVGGLGRDPAAGGADKETGLDEEGFVHVLQGVFLLADRGGQGFQANGSTLELLDQGQEDAPVLKVDIDRIQARALGLSIGDVNATLAISFGSAYANDFTREGRVLRVLLQADAASRMTPQDVLELRVRSANGDMVPFGSFSKAAWSAEAPQLQRYNGYPAMTISGEPAPGQSTGEAMAEMERLAQTLPAGFAALAISQAAAQSPPSERS